MNDERPLIRPFGSLRATPSTPPRYARSRSEQAFFPRCRSGEGLSIPMAVIFILHPSSLILPRIHFAPMKRILRWLLYATIPVALALQFLHVSLVWQFVLSC